MIRSAAASDIPGLVTLFRQHHAAMGCSWSQQPARLSMTFAHAIATPDNWLCLTGDGCLFLATCFESPLGAGKVATELCFCVGREKLDDLVARYEAWARAKGCDAISLGCEQRFSAFERLYRRLGYRISEMTTSKVL